MLKKLVPIFLCAVLLSACQKSGDDTVPTRAVLTDDAKGAYISLLTDLRESQTLPGGEKLEYDMSDISSNRFAVCDVDFDMSPELIIEYQSASIAGSALLVYDYDPQTNAPYEEFRSSLGETFYGNAALKVEWSSNNGYAGETLWPYSLYKYDSKTDSYAFCGAVQAWDKAQYETGPDGAAFPDDIDADGDGIIYYISQDVDNVYSASPVDYAAYDNWVSSVTADADIIDLSFLRLTEENIQNLNYEESSTSVRA